MTTKFSSYTQTVALSAMLAIGGLTLSSPLASAQDDVDAPSEEGGLAALGLEHTEDLAGRAAEFFAPFAELANETVILKDDLETALGRLEEIAKANIDDVLTDVTVIRQDLALIASALEEGGMAHHQLDALEAWVGANITRINNQRDFLGDRFVDEALLPRYHVLQELATEAREHVYRLHSELRDMLRQLAVSERQAAELALVAAGEIAIGQVLEALTGLQGFLDDVGEQLAIIAEPAV